MKEAYTAPTMQVERLNEMEDILTASSLLTGILNLSWTGDAWSWTFGLGDGE